MNTPKAHKAKPEKSMPLGGLQYEAIPYFGRTMELIHLKQAVRSVLSNRHDSGEVEKRLGSFAPVTVRGDLVPTMAEGYAALIDLVNREGGRPLQTELPSINAGSDDAHRHVTPKTARPVTDQGRGPVKNPLAEIVRVLRLEIQLVLKPQTQSTHNAEIIKFDVAA